MVISTGAYSEDLWPGIIKWFGETYDNYPTIYTRLVDKYDSDKQFEKFQGSTTFPLAGVKDQGSGIPYRDKFQGFPKEIVNIAYGIGSTITYEMMRYDQYNLFKKIPQQLAESYQKTMETIFHNFLNNGFSTASSPTTTADNLSLFNAAHLLVGANNTTFRNTPQTASDLSQSSLEQTRIDIARFVDDQNLPILARAVKLVVPSESINLAEKIVKTEYEVNTNNNTINPVSSSRMPLEVIDSPWLTDTDGWFVKTSVPDGLVMTEVDPVMLDRDNEFDTKNLKFSAMGIVGGGAVDPRGYYGSPGA